MANGESPVQSMWGNIIPLMQMVMQQRLQTRQLNLQERGVEQNAFSLFSDLASSSANPEQTDQVIDFFSERFGIDREALVNYANVVAPQSGVVTSATQKEGRDNLAGSPEGELLENEAFSVGVTGMGRGAVAEDELTRQLLEGGLSGVSSLMQDTLRNYARTRRATGLTPGELLLDEGTAAMTPEQLGQAVLMRHGLRMTAPQRENLALGYANLRQDERALDQQFTLAMADRELARLSSGDRTAGEIPELLNLKVRLQADWTAAERAGRANDNVRRTYAASLAAINTELRLRGVQTEDVPSDPMFNPPPLGAQDAGPSPLGFMERIGGWVQGRNPLLTPSTTP